MPGLTAAVPAVQEEVQQRAQDQQEKRQDAKEMGGMLGHEKKGGNA